MLDITEESLTRHEAEAAAAHMGLEGIHTMPDGGFMPGSSHEAFAAAVERAHEKAMPLTTEDEPALHTDSNRSVNEAPKL